MNKNLAKKVLLTCQTAPNGAYRSLATLLLHCLKDNLNSRYIVYISIILKLFRAESHSHH